MQTMTSRTQSSPRTLAEVFAALSSRMLKSSDVFRTVGELIEQPADPGEVGV